VSNAPREEIGQLLLPNSFALAVAVLAVYALCAMLLTTATLVAGTLQVRHYLLRATVDRTLAQRHWIAVFGVSGFRQLVPKLAPMLVQSAEADGRVALQTWFNPNEMRSEVARLYYISLGRCHFFSALIVLAGLVGLGLAQDRGSLPFLPGAIPTSSAILTLVGLMLLAALGRIVIDVTAEPLIETIAQLPAERAEIALLRRAVESLEMARNTPASGSNVSASAPPQLPEGLVAMIEQGHHALLDAVDRLTANTEALEAAVRSSVERLVTAAHNSAAPQDSLDRLAATTEALEAAVRSSVEMLATAVHKPAAPQVPLDAFTELRGALEELTALIRGLSAPPEGTQGASLPVGPVDRRRAPAPHLARELQSLLQEIEAAR
jgi:hypothetical protein